jgi:hypothetical protein
MMPAHTQIQIALIVDHCDNRGFLVMGTEACSVVIGAVREVIENAQLVSRG